MNDESNNLSPEQQAAVLEMKQKTEDDLVRERDETALDLIAGDQLNPITAAMEEKGLNNLGMSWWGTGQLWPLVIWSFIARYFRRR
jgi:hypothetical protein